MKQMAIIVPSRGRPQNIEDLQVALAETNTKATLWVVCDDDDPELDHYREIADHLLVYPREGKGMAKPLNRAARELLDAYDFFCFLGDDHRPRTDKWDELFIKALEQDDTDLVYGNDLLQGENLPTAIAMTEHIVRNLGGMVPPNMIHLYLDNFWLQLGKDIGGIRYLGNVVLEHLHPAAGKASWDEGYRDVNAAEVYDADAKAYHDYITSEEYQQLLRRLVNLQ